MGVLRFVFPSDSLPPGAADQAYVTGYDRIPCRVEVTQEDGQLLVRRDTSDSGNLHIPWNVGGHGRVTLVSASLMERPEPYSLPVELARGELSQLRNHVAEWSQAGTTISQEVHQRIGKAMAFFAQATCTQQSPEVAARAADDTLRATLDAANLLAREYALEALASRSDEPTDPPMILGANLGASLLDENTSVHFLESFNAAGISLAWREIETTQGSFYWDIADKQIEWCQRHQLTVCAGPLLTFDPWRMPQWLSDYDGDFDGIIACVANFIQTVVARYRSAVHIWICGARTNTSEALSLSEHERIRLTARAVEVTQSMAPDARRLVSFDQPWGEYLSRKTVDFSPLHFADALVRARLGLTGLMLEMNMGYLTGGTLLRDPLDMSRHLDYWSLLGVPIHLGLTVPSGCDDDPLAVRRAQVQVDQCSGASQAKWIEQFVPLALAKGYVEGVLWNQLRDSEPHDFAHGGLFDTRRQPKPGLEKLREIRKAHLS